MAIFRAELRSAATPCYNSVAAGVPVVNGQATVSVSNQGLRQIVTFTATYSGDANDLPAQSPTGVMEVFQGTLPVLVQGQTGGLTRNATFPVVLQ